MKFSPRVPEQLRSVGRFPVSVAVSVVLTVLLNLQIADFIAMSERLAGEVISALAAAFLAALVAALWFDARRPSTIAGVIAGVVAAILAALLQFFHGTVYSQDAVAIGGLILATMVSAHLRREAKIESFWMFDLRLGIAAAMGILAIGIVCGGQRFPEIRLSVQFQLQALSHLPRSRLTSTWVTMI